MEPTYYVSPNGDRQIVSTLKTAYRLKNRGWHPEAELSQPDKPVDEEQAPEPAPHSKKPRPRKSD